MKKNNSLTWGLFNISPKYPFNFIKHTIKDFFIMLKRIPFVIRHGYYEQANYETYMYMIDMWKDIFTWYRDHRCGTGVVIDLPKDGNMNNEWEEANYKAYNEMLDKMLAELDAMAEDPFDHPDGYKAGDLKRQEAANRFFDMFKDMFFGLWD